MFYIVHLQKMRMGVSAGTFPPRWRPLKPTLVYMEISTNQTKHLTFVKYAPVCLLQYLSR